MPRLKNVSTCIFHGSDASISRMSTRFAACLLLAICASSANAGLIFQFSASSTFNGTSPTSPGTFLVAEFTNFTANSVKLKLTSNLSVSSEFIDHFTFNVGKTISSIAYESGSPTFTASTINPNNVNLQGGGNLGKNFDLGLNWGSNSFNGTDVVTFKITSTTTLNENDFLFTNNSGKYVGVHIQGIPLGDGTTISGAIGGTVSPVPEPTSLIMFATVVGLCAGRRRKK